MFGKIGKSEEVKKITNGNSLGDKKLPSTANKVGVLSHIDNIKEELHEGWTKKYVSLFLFKALIIVGSVGLLYGYISSERRAELEKQAEIEREKLKLSQLQFEQQKQLEQEKLKQLQAELDGKKALSEAELKKLELQNSSEAQKRLEAEQKAEQERLARLEAEKKAEQERLAKEETNKKAEQQVNVFVQGGGVAQGELKQPTQQSGLIAGRYKDNNDGTVTDVVTRLQWMRCSLGQVWKENTCEKSRKSNRPDNEKIYLQFLHIDVDDVNNNAYSTYHDWRIPSNYELMSLVYCDSGNPSFWKKDSFSCAGKHSTPTINTFVFPNTFIDLYATSTKHNLTEIDGNVYNKYDATYTRVVDFSNGSSKEVKTVGGYTYKSENRGGSTNELEVSLRLVRSID